MLSRIIALSLRHRLVVILAWAGIAIAGVFAFRSLPFDAFPDTTPVQVQINTVAPALSAVEIERRATARVEQAIAGLPGLTEVRSLSRFGFSQITATFEDGTDIWLARQSVAERLAHVESEPGIESPQMGPVATGLGEVFHYLVRSDDASLSELRTAHDWMIRPELRSVPGVAEVNAWGGLERQVRIVLDTVALQQRGLTVGDVFDAVTADNVNVGGGPLDGAGEAALVQGIALAATPAELGAIVVRAENGVPTLVRDVARIVEGHELRRGAVTANGKGEVVLGLGFLLMGENSHEVTRALSTRLAEITKTLPKGIEVVPVYERTQLVDTVLRTVRTNLFEAALLVVAVLFVFLGNVRAGLIVASAIPLSMLVAFDLMSRIGIAGSLMSLGAIDFGLVVDSSVIQVENVVRRLGIEGKTRSRIDIVRDAAIEVRGPTMYGELIIMIVYVPVLALEGIEGKLFRPMALTVICALIGSIALSLTLMPVLSSLFLRARGEHHDTFLLRGLKRLYRPVLSAALRWRATVIVAAVAAVAAAAVLATRLGTEFVPRLAEGAIVINTVRLSGVSIDESVRYGTHIERALLAAFPDEIENVWTRTGTAEVATDPMGVELSDVFVTLTPRDQWRKARTQAELVTAMQSVTADLPGMRAIYTQPIEMRVNEMVAGIRADVGVKIFGDDLAVLEQKGAEVRAILEGIDGATDLFTEQATGQPIVRVVVDREAIARHGISAREVMTLIEALGGIHVGTLQEGERRFPIAVALDARQRMDEHALERIIVLAANGDQIPLGLLARIERAEGASTVNREWGRRRLVVQANVSGRDIGSFVADAQRAIDARVSLPAGYSVRFGGQFEHYQKARDRLLVVVPIALLSIFVLLYFAYGRVIDALRVFTGVPFAVIGGVLALWLRDLPFSVSAGVGFVALSGVCVLADMVLVSTIRELRSQGWSTRDAILEAADRRLRPVLMTSLVAALGFLPMALNTGMGSEVQRPLATVVIGGLASSTLLTLVVLPVLYLVTAGRGKRPEAPVD